MASLLLRGLVLGFAIAATPGPIFFLCFNRTLSRGRLTGLVSGLGVATADGFYSALAAYGVAAVTSQVAGQRRWLGLIGGLILIVLGLRTLLIRGSADSQLAPDASGLTAAYFSTLGLTIANPATILAFAAVSVLGFGRLGGYLAPAAFVSGVLVGSAIWWVLLASLAALLRPRLTPVAIQGISFFSGLAITGFGLLALASAAGLA